SPVTLAAQASTMVQVVVSVPSTATNGMRDTTIITAASSNTQAYAQDVTLVLTGTVGDLLVNKWADVERVIPGGVVRFTIAVTKTGSLTGTLLLTDTAVPTAALSLWKVPANCTGVTVTGQITCAWNLPSDGSTFTKTFDVVITTTKTYTGLLINTAEVSAAALDSDRSYNTSRAVVSIMSWQRIYLPLVMRNYTP
ncbi:MAG: DUF11 domain-containing protein, partial [Anaerolineae bacterium]|nr:DUF11 domain-containing protein [Anaerolineae bacterium]